MPDIEAKDLECLARVAEGRAADVPEATLARLQAAGLVTLFERAPERSSTMELTPAGLAHVRSSDQ